MDHLSPGAHGARLDDLPVAVLGAGPVGLAAAAQLAERGIPFVVVEAGPGVGANLLDYGHVRLFSPWRYDVDRTMRAQLERTGWKMPPPEDLPLARDVVARVLEPFSRLPHIAPHLRLGTQVLAVSREGFDKVRTAGREKAPFAIRAEHAGRGIVLQARAVIDATGTWNSPNPLGASGLAAIGEDRLAPRIFYGIPDAMEGARGRYAGKKVLVVGAGHSAANALLLLAELARQHPGTRLAWAVRSPVLTRLFGGGDADALAARGALGKALRQLRDSAALEFIAGLRIAELREHGGQVQVLGTDTAGRELRIDGVDEIICATGQRPNLALTRELRLRLDPALESTEALGPLIDPNVHSCGTIRPHGHRELAHPEPGFYTVGVKSYGRAPTFLMATGFEQVRSVVAAIAGDFDAADRVELDLPETGVCSASFAPETGDGTGLAGSPGRDAAACCAPATAPTPAASEAGSCGPNACGGKAPANVGCRG